MPRRLGCLLLYCLALGSLLGRAHRTAWGDEPPAQEILEARRVVFLGDSITAAGQYVAWFDAWLATKPADAGRPELIDMGLPSETVSGLSEDGHAGGQFPRPDLAERLERVLELARPDLVVACYGINCGIYQPFDEERLARYQAGMRALAKAVEQAGARLVVITPPFYDDQRAPLAFSYNEVLDRYSAWLVSQREESGWTVLDLHSAMTAAVQKRRQNDPKFTFQPDGVHPSDEGHWFIAAQLIRWCGDEAAAGAAGPAEMLASRSAPAELAALTLQRTALLRDAYVGAAGHLRPGIAKGLPVEEARAQAAKLTERIEELAKQR